MFQLVQYDGSPMDRAYVQLRSRNEPLVENTQIKGTSDTHPFLSPKDEWADFEIFPYRIASRLRSQPQGSYVREAYRNGLQLGDSGAGNPYRFGVIGASDTHNAGESFQENRFVGASGLLSHTPEQRGSVPVAVGESAGSSNVNVLFEHQEDRRHDFHEEVLDRQPEEACAARRDEIELVASG